MATHFSILAWKIPWTEEPGVLQSIGMQRVRHNLETEHTHTHTHTHGRNAGHLKFSLAQCALFDFSYFSYMLFILDSFCCCAFMFKHLFLILCLFKHLPHAVHVSFQTLKVFPQKYGLYLKIKFYIFPYHFKYFFISWNVVAITISFITDAISESIQTG